MFDLEQNILQWKNTLAAKELSNTDIDELESHLREEINNLKLKELNDDEAFWVASKRLGSADLLSIEFEKVNYSTMIKKRIIWGLGGIMIYSILNILYGLLVQIYSISPLLLGWKPETIFYFIISTNSVLTIGICYGVYNFVFKNDNWIEKFFVKAISFKKRKTNKKILIYSVVLLLFIYFIDSIIYRYIISPYINSNAYRFGAIPFYKYLATYQTIWFGLITCFIFYLFIKLYNKQIERKFVKE